MGVRALKEDNLDGDSGGRRTEDVWVTGGSGSSSIYMIRREGRDR